MKYFVIEVKPATWEGEEPKWRQLSEKYTELCVAEREWEALDRVRGHDTYHRIVKVKRKVLRSA